jgi:hypothetical protein
MTTVIDDRLALRVWEVSARERDCVRINIRTPLSGQRGDIGLYVLRLINPGVGGNVLLASNWVGGRHTREVRRWVGTFTVSVSGTQRSTRAY